jgi:cathepsin L
MKLLLAFALLGFAAASYQDFLTWARIHGKTYESDEIALRYRVWLKNSRFIEKHNAEGHPYTLAMNEFGDLHNEEFKAVYLGYRSTDAKAQRSLFEAPVSTNLPSSMDWRDRGAVTPIKNQGQCGSCWSFSATGSMEGAHFLSTNDLVGLSEQNLVDCSQKEGNEGCNGGLMDDAFEYVIKNNGIDTEASYPYNAVQGTCRFNSANVGATISSYQDIASGNETALEAAVATIGPISVAMDASSSSFQFYSSGIYWSYFCSPTALDHGVLAVGYGATTKTSSTFLESKSGSWNGMDYWIVKNSWGTTWGQQGYFWLARNDDNMCGVATDASYPIV